MSILTQEVIHEAETPADDLAGVLRDYMDVTERLARTHETLQREIERLREELESKDRELERRRRLAALGEMAAGVAHEVRNPLGAIQLYSNLLRAQCGGATAALDLIQKIESGIATINRVVQDTLALAPRPNRFERCNLSAVVQRAADACAPALALAAAELSISHDDDDVSIHVDGDGLHRALVNLITNAAEASPVGGRVAICTQAEHDGVAIHVLDEGPGLPVELLDRVFDPFVTTKDKGTGLGLTIAHRLVEAHGGGLTVRNRPAGGADFIIRIPRADGSPSPVAAATRFDEVNPQEIPRHAAAG